MTDNRPDNNASPLREHARIQLLTCLIEESDYAGNLAETLDDATAGDPHDPGFPPGHLTRMVRNTRAKALATLTAAVHYELACGRTWEQIAEGLGQSPDFAQDHYGPGYEQWRNDLAIRLAGLPAAAYRPASRWPGNPLPAISRWREARLNRQARRVSSP